MDERAAITVKNLRRRFGPLGRRGFEAVRGVSFAVRRGELFAVLGTNGAGKTSTLEVLQGLACPTSGEVRVLDRDPYRERRQVRPRIGMMLQEGGFPGDLTVMETGRMWAGTLSAPRPVEEALELVDLRDRAQVTVKQLSGGERRRLDLALAVLGRPEMLFLDEPTTGLDVESRLRCWALLRELLQEGTTMVLTTHYLQEAEELADRLAILHRGVIVRTGTPVQIATGRPARISFALSQGAQSSLPDLPGAVGTDESTTSDGRTLVVVRTQDLQRSLAALLGWAEAREVKLHALNARSASLEEAFLAVTQSETESATDPGHDQEVAA